MVGDDNFNTQPSIVSTVRLRVGTHLAAVLNAPLQGWESDVAFAAFAATRGLDLDPLSTHAGVAEGRQGFLLGYAAWDEQNLVAGVETLAALLAEER